MSIKYEITTGHEMKTIRVETYRKNLKVTEKQAELYDQRINNMKNNKGLVSSEEINKNTTLSLCRDGFWL